MASFNSVENVPLRQRQQQQPQQPQQQHQHQHQQHPQQPSTAGPSRQSSDVATGMPRPEQMSPRQHLTVTAAGSSSSSTRQRNRFVCTSCGSQFSRQTILNEHIRAEHLQERIPCTICGKLFKRQNDRRRHETFQHLKRRAFQCKNNDFGCGKRFTRLDSLKEHQSSPRKVGTTCEMAMLHGRAVQQTVPSTARTAAPSIPQTAATSSTTMPTPDPLPSFSMPPRTSVEPAPSLTSSISSTTPTLTADDDFSQAYEGGLRIDGTGSEQLSIGSGRPGGFQPGWPMDMPETKLPQYTNPMVPLWQQPVSDAQIRSTAAELAICMTTAEAMTPHVSFASQPTDMWPVSAEAERLDDNTMWSIPWSWQMMNDISNNDPSSMNRNR